MFYTNVVYAWTFIGHLWDGQKEIRRVVVDVCHIGATGHSTRFGEPSLIFFGKKKFHNGTNGHFMSQTVFWEMRKLRCQPALSDHSTVFARWHQQHNNRRLTLGRIPWFHHYWWKSLISEKILYSKKSDNTNSVIQRRAGHGSGWVESGQDGSGHKIYII